jgi:hypothetical protein
MRLLELGNGHQLANRRVAMGFVLDRIPEVAEVDERTVEFPPYGLCHFSAYTHPEGAMISTPGRGDETFGSADWHARDKIMMFRDFGDGRCIVYVCPIKPLFSHRTIGHHGVRWTDVLTLAEFKQVFRI